MKDDSVRNNSLTSRKMKRRDRTAHTCVVKSVSISSPVDTHTHTHTPLPSCLSSWHHPSPVTIRSAALSSLHGSPESLFCLSELRWHWHQCLLYQPATPSLWGETSTSDPFKSLRNKGITNRGSVGQSIGILHKAVRATLCSYWLFTLYRAVTWCVFNHFTEKQCGSALHWPHEWCKPNKAPALCWDIHKIALRSRWDQKFHWVYWHPAL